MAVRKTISWNMLIMGDARLGEIEHWISLLKKMQLLGVEGNVTTFGCLMNACSDFSDPRFGRMIQAFIYQKGWDVAVEVNNSVLSFYSKFGFCNNALKAFESMETRTIVSWIATMKFGDAHGALLLFLMQLNLDDFTPNQVHDSQISWRNFICLELTNEHG
uniref:Pentatricopeptide repeat-containing protein At2g36980, mitochondrial n=1 Tax=Elaeis guineensis var. tenera TaxID=51953 RepID=A0A6I9QDB9_ELAGV|nr:pentatricopeptide repeat-containing protein At2g36980, mitochondrial [Elaeis guineensis]